MKTIRLRYFASIRETLGTGSETLQTSAESVCELRDQLIARGGGYAEVLARGRAVRTAVNQVMSSELSELQDGVEVAFFPPVTGG